MLAWPTKIMAREPIRLPVKIINRLGIFSCSFPARTIENPVPASIKNINLPICALFTPKSICHSDAMTPGKPKTKAPGKKIVKHPKMRITFLFSKKRIVRQDIDIQTLWQEVLFVLQKLNLRLVHSFLTLLNIYKLSALILSKTGRLHSLRL